MERAPGHTFFPEAGMVPYQGGMGREMSRLREEAMQPLAQLAATDLIERGNEFFVNVDLPGADNVDVSVDNGVLTITADRKISHEENTDVIHRMERSFGKVTRRLTLPSNANADQARAKSVNGVLTITIPKCETSKRKKLSIE